MKSVNHFLAIIFFVILYPNNSFSQSNFKAGYVIDIQKDTIRGFIDYRNWDKTPKKIVFKTVSDLITIYTPINIKCFSVASEIYVSGIVTIDESPFRENELTESIMPQNRTDTVFLQILINGPKSLYYLKDKNLKEHYFIGQNGGFETLFFKKYLQNINGAMYSKTNEQYKGQLVVYFQDYLSIQKKIYSVTYSKKDLIELFKEYYKYTQNKILYQSDPEKMKSEFGLLGGLSQTKLKFIGSDDYYKVLYNTDYPLSQNFTFGVFYNIILPRKQGKFSIDNELMFASYKLNIMDIIPYEAGSFYVADKGYTDFLRLYRIHTNGSFFVTRAKENLQFKRMYSRAVDKTTGVQSDHIGKLMIYKSKKEYPEKLRRIKFYDIEHDKDLVFLTNNMDLKASEIAFLYKKRWAVELFFKWMKQHLKIKSFWGTTLNAVKIQVYCAVIAYCLVALVGNKLKVDRSIYEILQILSISLLDKTPIKEILTKCDYNNVKELQNNQLIISGF